MDPKRYERLTNASILLAVTCALLFERVGSLKWLTGVLAIVAGMVAVVVYFINQNSGHNANASNEQALLKIGPDFVTVPAPTQSNLEETEHAQFDWASAAQKSLYDALLQQREVKIRDVYYLWDTNLVQTSPRRKLLTHDWGQEFVQEVVEIVRRLSASDESPSFEFTIARDGSFTIRSTKTSSSWNVERPSEREEEAIEDAPHLQKLN